MDEHVAGRGREVFDSGVSGGGREESDGGGGKVGDMGRGWGVEGEVGVVGWVEGGGERG